MFKLVLFAAINAFLLAVQRPIEAQSRIPAVETESPSPTPTVETDAPFPSTILETIDFDADAGLKDLNVAHLTKSLTQRHWDNDDWVEELQQRVVAAWQALGYFKAEANVSGRRVRKSPQERVYAVTVRVHAGRRYRLGEIHIVNAKEFTSDELRSLFPLEAGDVLNLRKLSEGFDSLRQVYESRGFIKVMSAPETTVDEAHDRISITVDVDEGPQFHISEIKVLGLDSELIERLMHNSGLKPGDVYSQSAVEDFFAKNRKELPPGADEASETSRKVDEQNRTVNLVFDFSRCNPRCD